MGCYGARQLLGRDPVLMLVTTESGSQYEIEADRVRRINPAHTKRGDGDWQPLVSMFPKVPKVGYPMVLVVESLTRYGGDDLGTPPELADEVTTRRTTSVTAIEEPSNTQEGTK